MKVEDIKSWSDLVAYADEKIQYPFEEFLEKHIGIMDTLTDHICAAVVIAENIGDTSVETKNKLARRLLIEQLEISGWNPLLVKFVDLSLIFAIETVIDLLDSIFPSGWNNLIDLLFDMDLSLSSIFPKLKPAKA